MRYSYEFKKKAIELFNRGEWPKTPNGVTTDTFHKLIRDWVKLEQHHGVNDTLRMYKNDDIRMYNFDCITDTIVEVITTCNTYTVLTVHLL